MSSIEAYHNKPIEVLEQLHTGTLMRLRDESYKVSVCDCCRLPVSESQCDWNKQQDDVRSKILQVLMTREHIPNKAEKKAIRQAAAKQGR